MTGIELVAGYLAAWAARRGRHAVGRLGRETDQAMDHVLDQLHDRVYARLGNRSVLQRLESDAEHGVTDPAVHADVQFMVGSAAAADPAFARELGQIVGRLEKLRPTVTVTSVDRGSAMGGARSRQATGAYSQVGHRVNIGSFGAGGAVLVVLIVAVVVVYFLRTNAREPSDVRAYRTQSATACQDVGGVLRPNYNAALMTGGLDSDPGDGSLSDLSKIDRSRLVKEMNSRLAKVQGILEVFFAQSVPDSLHSIRQTAAERAATWERDRATNAGLIRKHVRERFTMSELDADLSGVPLRDENKDLQQLASSLGRLSGQSCSLVTHGVSG